MKPIPVFYFVILALAWDAWGFWGTLAVAAFVVLESVWAAGKLEE